MSDIMFKIRLEHRNIENVLDLLGDQAQRLAVGAPSEAGVIALALDYLKGFPEECHHPKEDLVFQMLKQRHPAVAGTLVDLDLEHEKLAEATDRISTEIASHASTAELGELLSHYVNTYRAHIAGEEQYFFPAALQSLSRDDFGLLDYELFDRKDRLFDDVAENRFDKLKHRIKERAQQNSLVANGLAGRSAVEELALLRSINSVESFNDKMGEQQLQLIVYHSGGYSLQQSGRWLLDIPDCEQHCAAWCAYFYWKALVEDRNRQFSQPDHSD